FVPDLPEKRAALSRLEMGAVLKAVLWFRTAFWTELGATHHGFLHVPGGRFMTWWPLGDSPLLTGWSGGPRAMQLSAQSDDAILAAAIADLAQGFTIPEDRVGTLLIEGRVFNWTRDPLALGAYSYAAVGGAEASSQLAAPVADTIFFAGEATDATFPATVAGAVRSGYRAAEEALRGL